MGAPPVGAAGDCLCANHHGATCLDLFDGLQDAADQHKEKPDRIKAERFHEVYEIATSLGLKVPALLAAWGRAEYAALLAVMASGKEGRLVVGALLDRAMPVLPAQAFDPEKLTLIGSPGAFH